MYQVIAIILFFFICKFGTYYYTENLLGPITLCALLALMIRKKLDSISAIFFLYVSMHSIYNLYTFPTKYGQFGINYNHYFKTVLGSGMIFVLLFIPIIFIRSCYFKELYKILIYLPVINSLLVIADWFIYDSKRGLMGATSIDSALIACTFPVLLNHLISKLKNYATDKLVLGAATLLCIMAVLMLKGSVGIGCLLIGIAIIFIQQKYYWQLLIFSAGVLSAAYLNLDRQLFDSMGRFEVYRIAMTHWLDHMDIWWGSGLSTYWVLGPLLQDKNNILLGSYFTFMHSDILQFVFEFGIVGGILLLTFLINVFYRIIKDQKKYMLAPVSSYLFFASLYFPLHSFLTAFIGVLIFTESLNGNTQDNEDDRLRERFTFKGSRWIRSKLPPII